MCELGLAIGRCGFMFLLLSSCFWKKSHPSLRTYLLLVCLDSYQEALILCFRNIITILLWFWDVDWSITWCSNETWVTLTWRSPVAHPIVSHDSHLMLTRVSNPGFPEPENPVFTAFSETRKPGFLTSQISYQDKNIILLFYHTFNT